MRLIITVDNFLLSFFTKISHRFYRLMGRTNFFLAKFMVCIMTALLMIAMISFWFPLFFKPSVTVVIISGLNLIFCLVDLNRCDEAESKTLSNEHINIFGPYLSSSIVRVISLALLLYGVILILFPLYVYGKNDVFDAIMTVYVLAWISFLYFIAVDPPAPGKSKIRESSDSFSAGFRKLVPIKAKN